MTGSWLRTILLLSAIVVDAGQAARAGSADLWGTDTEYKLTFNYAAGVRTKKPDQRLINGPIDPLVAGAPILNPVPGQPVQVAGFTHTGLPTTINIDDGNRNFQQWSMVHNRLTAFGELQFKRESYGAIFSGDAFYDQAYRQKNDNDSPATVNTMGIANNQFTPETRHYDGLRMRLLDAYAYFDHSFTDEIALNLRVGQQVVAWGESLFLRGIALSQGRADATRSSVAGAEIKELLLPTNQVGLQLSLSNALTLLGYYKLDFAATELFPTGDFLSPADLIGPGATFTHGSINPAYLDGCPGLLDLGTFIPGLPLDLSALCTVGGGEGGLGDVLLNAAPNIYVYRGEDINPSSYGQYGVGLKAAVTDLTTLGFFHLRYADSNPTVQLNPGFAYVGTVPGTNFDITTGLFNQYVPVTYNIKYFGGIKLYGMSFSSTLGPLNVGGEFNYHQGIDTQVQTIISGVLSPVFTRADIGQVLLSAIYAGNPDFLVNDIAVVAETAYHHVYSVDEFEAQPGIIPVGDGKQLFGNRNAWGFQTLVQGTTRNVLPGWDLKSSMTFGALVKGNPSISGQFGPLYGEGDQRLGVGLGLQYLQNFEVGINYQKYFGNADRVMRGSPVVFQNPYADRDYIAFNIKYNLL
ncbi:MAG: DUF1302 family protein [Stagnimonas sp.]|nr:DUF1302 family protein [Stagnimonas sp.]